MFLWYIGYKHLYTENIKVVILHYVQLDELDEAGKTLLYLGKDDEIMETLIDLIPDERDESTVENVMEGQQ